MFASRITKSILVSLVFILGLSSAGFAQKKKDSKVKKPKPFDRHPVLWRDPEISPN